MIEHLLTSVMPSVHRHLRPVMLIGYMFSEEFYCAFLDQSLIQLIQTSAQRPFCAHLAGKSEGGHTVTAVTM